MVGLIVAWLAKVDESPRRHGTLAGGHQVFGPGHVVHFTELFPVAIASVTFGECPALMAGHDALVVLSTGTILARGAGRGRVGPRCSAKHVVSVRGPWSTGAKGVIKGVF